MIHATSKRLGSGICEEHLKDLARMRALGEINDARLQELLDALQSPEGIKASESRSIADELLSARLQEREEKLHHILRVLADAQTRFSQLQSTSLDKAMETFATNGKNGRLDPVLALIVDICAMASEERELVQKMACEARDIGEFNQQRNLFWLTKQPVIKQKDDGAWVANCPYRIFHKVGEEFDALNKLIIDEMKEASKSEPQVSITGGEPNLAFVQAVPPPFAKLKKKIVTGGEPFLAIGQLSNGDWAADAGPVKQAIDELAKRITQLGQRQQLDSKRFAQELRTIANTVDPHLPPSRAPAPAGTSRTKPRERHEDRQDQPRHFPRGNRRHPTGGDEPEGTGDSTNTQRPF